MPRSRMFTFAIAGLALAGAATLVTGDAKERYMQWDVHDPNRPQPAVVDPGHPGTQDATGKAPSDAIVLFGGTKTDAIQTKWPVNDKGELVITKGTGGFKTSQAFGDIQLHLEWMAPESESKNSGQGRGNSGIFFMSQYELQVLDNKDNKTYPDGMAGSIYGQFPPLANPGRGIGKWQTYDIVFRRPHFNEDGSLAKPARITAFLNGVLVQDNQELMGRATHKKRTGYNKHADKLPLTLQNHGQTVHYRNIWVRELEPRDD
ncbi:MAG: 3-keto-disaccharide hydrolase [Phycisphaeraceae bacterium]